MNGHLRNSYHNRNPHLHSVRKPANHPRSDVINTMQDVNNSAQLSVQSKNRCASAESSTTICSRACADLNTSEPNHTLLKHSNQSSPLNSHNLSLHLKLKGSRQVDVIRSSTGRLIRSTDDTNEKTIICTNTEAIQLSGGLHDCGPIASGLKVQDLLVCCMCGDAGIADLLFLCSKCSHRHQHIYCSRSYPDMGEEASICNWCLHKEDSMNSSMTVKACGDAIANSPNIKLHRFATSQLIHRDPQCKFGINHLVFEDEDAPDADEVMVKKGHSKAFEYLLLVAAQYLPPDQNRATDNTSNTEIREDNRIPISTTSPPAVGNRSSDITKANATPLVNIVNVGPLEGQSNSMNPDGKSNGMNPRNSRLIVSLNTKNMRIHSPVKISIDHKSMDVSRFIQSGSNTPKRQRCNKGINASLKCRKKGLQLSPSRPNYRRYKLLADVVC